MARMREVIVILGCLLAPAAGSAAPVDSTPWDRLKACLDANLADPVVMPLPPDRAFSVIEIMCEPEIQTAERHLAAQAVEDGTVSSAVEMALTPSTVHRVIQEGLRAYVAQTLASAGR